MEICDSDDSLVPAKLQRFDLSGKTLYKNKLLLLVENTTLSNLPWDPGVHTKVATASNLL